MIWRSRNITLALVGTGAALLGFTAVAIHRSGADGVPSTQPSGYGGRSHSTGFFHHSFFGSSTGGGYRSSSSSSSSSHTSRGGFGSSGHSAST